MNKLLVMYPFNPHRHVKIWLSSKPNVFLNPLNQLRLVRLRAMNPADKITFFYDANLLTPEAIQELNAFCTKHSIQALDVQHAVFPLCRHPLDRRLIAAYQDEVDNLERGGNLASASDKLRLLAPVILQGTYSDFDVDVKTASLPDTIEVNSPLMIRLSSFFPYRGSSDERVSVNNEVFAVVNYRDALPTLQSIKEIALSLYEKQKPGTPIAKLPYSDDTSFMGLLLSKLAYQQNARQIRHSIMQLAQSNESFYKAMCFFDRLEVDGERLSYGPGTKECSPQALHAMGLEIKMRLLESFSSASEPRKVRLRPLLLSNNSRDFLDFNRQELEELMIQKTVISSTGPNAYCFGILGGNHFNATLMQREVNPVALATYGLQRAFISSNGYPMHVTIEEKQIAEEQSVNDASWLACGIQTLFEKEQRMDEAARIIQNKLLRR
ncbi:MAG TPA: hypothetical protein DCZ80_02235 [Legionellales bacterium]|nr:hypothetical protein [Legionellales bacterium]